MRSLVLLSTVSGALALALVGCGGEADALEGHATNVEALVTPGTYVTVRRDLRRCVAPLCGGYFVAPVDRPLTGYYVNALDFSQSDLDDGSVAMLLDAPDGEIVLRGRLGEREPRFHTRPMIVSEGFRGLPNVTARGTFYQVTVNDPPIMCITAPCNNENAFRLNHESSVLSFTRISLSGIPASLVDGPWLMNRIEAHKAIVVGSFVDGDALPGGPEKVLEATQVFVKLPDVQGPCPSLPVESCPDGQVSVFARTPDRCEVPDGCVEPSVCVQSLPVCDEGYVLHSWTAAPNACPAHVCEPLFSRAAESRCSAVRCAAGYHCAEGGPDACVVDETCATVLCAQGTFCIEENGTATCVSAVR